MVDLTKLTIQAGHGGDGRISFLRTRRQPKGGPDGGDGGNGGSVVFVGNQNLQTLRDFAGKQKIEGSSGQMGGKDKLHGKDFPDVQVQVPVGTVVWKVKDTYHPLQHKRMYRIDEDGQRREHVLPRSKAQFPDNDDAGNEQSWGNRPALHFFSPETGLMTTVPNVTAAPIPEKVVTLNGMELTLQWVGEVTAHAQEMVVAKGGKGGRGNWRFRSSTHTTPTDAETGEQGEGGEYVLELQLLADVGLVGYPNVGKSTLLSVLTNAKPTIANYPFTTLEPNLGAIDISERGGKEHASILIADIPGIIEGASKGKGLGLSFLRHIERCHMLIFVLASQDPVEPDTDATILAQSLLTQYQTLESELESYVESGKESLNVDAVPLKDKQRILVLNKTDLYTESQIKQCVNLFKSVSDAQLLTISAKTTVGIEELTQLIIKAVRK